MGDEKSSSSLSLVMIFQVLAKYQSFWPLFAKKRKRWGLMGWVAFGPNAIFYLLRLGSSRNVNGIHDFVTQINQLTRS